MFFLPFNCPDPIDWIQRQISVGVNPRELLVALVGPGCPLVSQVLLVSSVPGYIIS